MTRRDRQERGSLLACRAFLCVVVVLALSFPADASAAEKVTVRGFLVHLDYTKSALPASASIDSQMKESFEKHERLKRDGGLSKSALLERSAAKSGYGVWVPATEGYGFKLYKLDGKGNKQVKALLEAATDGHGLEVEVIGLSADDSTLKVESIREVGRTTDRLAPAARPLWNTRTASSH